MTTADSPENTDSQYEPVVPPYAAPESWLSDADAPPVALTRVTGGIAAAVGLASVWSTLNGPLVWAVIFAILFAVLAVATLGFGLGLVKRRPPQLINANTLGRATVRPIDDWVHFYGEYTESVWTRIWMTLSGLGTAVLLAIAMPGVLAAPGGLWWLILFVPLLVVCAWWGVYALMQKLLDRKNSSFGRIPVGLAIGRNGIARYLIAGGITFVRWEHITAIEPLPHSKIRVIDGRPEPLEFTAGVLLEHAPLIYNAIRFYWDHPELRSEVGTTIAQQRFESWHTAHQ